MEPSREAGASASASDYGLMDHRSAPSGFRCWDGWGAVMFDVGAAAGLQPDGYLCLACIAAHWP